MPLPGGPRWKILLVSITRNPLKSCRVQGDANGKEKHQEDKQPAAAGLTLTGSLQTEAAANTSCATQDGGGDEQTSRSRHKPGLISDSVQQAISGMVELSSDVIEEQIRAGQQAANRLREGIASSQKLDTDIHSMVENLVATTRDVGATWLDLVSLVIRAIGTQPPDPGKAWRRQGRRAAANRHRDRYVRQRRDGQQHNALRSGDRRDTPEDYGKERADKAGHA